MKRRVLIVFDGQLWFVRNVRSIEHDGVRDEKIYRCDEPIANDLQTGLQALQAAKRFLEGGGA